MKKQAKFTARGYRTDPDYRALDAKFRSSSSLEYVLMLGHIIVEEQLVALLASRLGADTMPDLRGFELIAGLALSGSKRKHLRDAVDALNQARNEVAHRMSRKKLDSAVETFVRAVKGKAGKSMAWPKDARSRTNQLRLGIRFFVAEIAFAIEYEQKLRKTGEKGM
jgi:uncharacterized membrane protein